MIIPAHFEDLHTHHVGTTLRFLNNIDFTGKMQAIR